MERKIGEIFEYNSEWYQCVEQPDYIDFACKVCFFSDMGNCELDRCSGIYRSDKKHVIFKKLKKVGELITVKGRNFQKLTFDNNTCKECVFNITNKACCKDSYIEGICDDNGFWIEIKQIKEDMEENKTPLPKEDNILTRTVYNYVNGKISDKELIKSIKEMSDEFPYYKNDTKPFSLVAAKSGKSVCTRDGRKARIICFDAKCNLPIIALITQSGGDESLARYNSNGRFTSINESDCDLMMLSEKKEGWMNVYKEQIYDTKEEAIKVKYDGANYIDTIKISWEE